MPAFALIRLICLLQLGGAVLGGTAGVAAGTLGTNNKGQNNNGGILGTNGVNTGGSLGDPGNGGRALDPGVTLAGSNARSLPDGQSAAQIAAANPQGNVFRQNVQTAATNPGNNPDAQAFR